MNDSLRRIDGLDRYIQVVSDSTVAAVGGGGVLLRLIFGALPARSRIGRPYDFLVSAGQNGLRIRGVPLRRVVARPQLRLALRDRTGCQGRC